MKSVVNRSKITCNNKPATMDVKVNKIRGCPRGSKNKNKNLYEPGQQEQLTATTDKYNPITMEEVALGSEAL